MHVHCIVTFPSVLAGIEKLGLQWKSGIVQINPFVHNLTDLQTHFAILSYTNFF